MPIVAPCMWKYQLTAVVPAGTAWVSSLVYPALLGEDVSRNMNHEPPCAFWAPVDDDGVFVPRTHLLLPLFAQPHRPLSKVHEPELACAKRGASASATNNKRRAICGQQAAPTFYLRKIDCSALVEPSVNICYLKADIYSLFSGLHTRGEQREPSEIREPPQSPLAAHCVCATRATHGVEPTRDRGREYG